eukprot:COSAG05_NODE_5552_length_1144_cov_1.327273_1_plen_277_part_00
MMPLKSAAAEPFSPKDFELKQKGVTKFTHGAERGQDLVAPEIEAESAEDKARRVRNDLAVGVTTWSGAGAGRGGWKAMARGETEFWGYGDRRHTGMTDQERFHFDLSGFFVRPAVLSPAEVAVLRAQVHSITHDPYSLPPSERKCPGGASSMLIDHPKIIEVLHEIIGPEVRLEAAGCMWRESGEREESGQGWHNGGPRSTDPIMGYRYHDGIIHAGMVRVIVELSDVKVGDGYVVPSARAPCLCTTSCDAPDSRVRACALSWSVVSGSGSVINRI